MSKFVGKRTETIPKIYPLPPKIFYKMAVVSKIQKKAIRRLYDLKLVTSMKRWGDIQNLFFFTSGSLIDFMMY